MHMRRHFPIVVEQDGDSVFIDDCPNFKESLSYGDTIEEAMNTPLFDAHPPS